MQNSSQQEFSSFKLLEICSYPISDWAGEIIFSICVSLMKNPGGRITEFHTLEVVSKSQPLKHNGERAMTPAISFGYFSVPPNESRATVVPRGTQRHTCVAPALRPAFATAPSSSPRGGTAAKAGQARTQKAATTEAVLEGPCKLTIATTATMMIRIYLMARTPKISVLRKVRNTARRHC